MSQAGIVSSSSGPVPPSVATSYVTNAGTAVPAANILNVLGDDSTANNDNGISTTGSGNTVTTVLSNRYTQTTSTVGAVNSVMTILTALAAGTYVFEMSIAAFAIAGGPSGDGYTIVGAIRSDGVTATLIPNQQKDSFEENVGANAVLGVSANTATVTVTGVAGITFDWKVTGTYMVVS